MQLSGNLTYSDAEVKQHKSEIFKSKYLKMLL